MPTVRIQPQLPSSLAVAHDAAFHPEHSFSISGRNGELSEAELDELVRQYTESPGSLEADRQTGQQRFEDFERRAGENEFRMQCADDWSRGVR